MVKNVYFVKVNVPNLHPSVELTLHRSRNKLENGINDGEGLLETDCFRTIGKMKISTHFDYHIIENLFLSSFFSWHSKLEIS